MFKLRILRRGGKCVTDIFVVEPAAADQRSERIPESLPVNSPERGPLERALRNAGLAIVPLDTLIGPPAAVDDHHSLRASVTAVVNAASDAELDRLRSAVT